MHQESSILNRSSCKSFPTSIKKESSIAKQMKSKFFQESSSSMSGEFSNKEPASLLRTPELNPEQMKVTEFIPPVTKEEKEKKERSEEVKNEGQLTDFDKGDIAERRRIYSFTRSARGEISSSGTPGFPRNMHSKEMKMKDTPATTHQVTHHEEPSANSSKGIPLSESNEESKVSSANASEEKSNTLSPLDIMHKQDSCPLSS